MRLKKSDNRRKTIEQRSILTLGVASLLLLSLVSVILVRRIERHIHAGYVPPPQYTAILDSLYPYVHSPNFNSRPSGEAVDCIVLHATGEFTTKGVIQTFTDPHEHTSAHFVVGRDGSVTQMVPVESRAWHAGVSSLGGVDGVNDYSIGIEMVDRDNGQPYTKAQYSSVAKLIDQLRCVYHIPQNRIVSHAYVALPPGRKSDPYDFDFGRLYTKMSTLEPAVAQQMGEKIALARSGEKLAQAD